MEILICKTIRARNIISFEYMGHKNIVEPFTLGIKASNNKLTLCAWCIEGHSETKKFPRWKMYQVSKISDLKIEDGKAAPHRLGYCKKDCRMKLVICTV